MPADDVHRARLRGLTVNPAIPAALLRRLVDEQFFEVRGYIEHRLAWTDEQFDALIDHPRQHVRERLAQAATATPDQRARLVEDPAPSVLGALMEGPEAFGRSFWEQPEPVLPEWAYRRALERKPDLVMWLEDCPWLPREWRARLLPGRTPAPPPPPPPTVEAIAALAADGNGHRRAEAAADPRLPAGLVQRLARDEDPRVRLAVSMRPELTEEQRAAIDYRVAPEDRVPVPAWVLQETDPDAQRALAGSAHIGLRRALACNHRLDPALIPVLAADDDLAVRLMLCESQRGVPSDLLLRTYLEARVMSRFRLLQHPAYERRGSAQRLADHPDPEARAQAKLDPELPADIVERLSRDADPRVRASVAGHRLLPPDRLPALLADPATAIQAAANPRLPVPLMEQILSEAAAVEPR